MSQKLLFAVLFAALLFQSVRAQSPGEFDPTYGDNGKKILPLGTANAFSRAVTLQPDGKAVLACITNNGESNDFAIVRLMEDGQPDPGFGTDGIVVTDFDAKTDIAEAVALDEFSRIIVAGTVDNGNGFDYAVARYLPDGRLDETFHEDGMATITVGLTGFCKAVSVQPDNKIVLGGYALNPILATNEFYLVRFDTIGQPDSTWGGDGIVKTNMGIGAGVANAMTIQPDGKILVAGQAFNESTFTWEIAIARYNQNGTLDETFGENGIVFTPTPGKNHTVNALTLQADHKIIVGGFAGTAPSDNLFTVARYHPDGTPDPAFGDNGIVIDSYGFQNNQIQTIVIQPDGHILLAGTTLIGNADHFALARLNDQGHFDPAFGEEGTVISTIGQNDGISDMALQDDGKLVVAGESFDGIRFNIVAARYETGLATRTHDPIQPVTTAFVYPNPIRDAFTVSYALIQPSDVRIAMYDMTGKELYLLANVYQQGPGEYEERYRLPVGLATGVYILSVTAGEEGMSMKVVVE